MKLTNEELNYELTHKHGGNGYVIVQVLDDNFCRVATYCSFGPTPFVGKQAFLAFGNMLSRFQVKKDPKIKDSPMVDALIPENVIQELSTLRKQIKSGQKVIISTHITDAKETCSQPKLRH